MNIEMTSFIGSLGPSDLKSFINVLDAYQINCYPDNISYIGLDNVSGASYMVLDNGITISSNYGEQVIYSTMDISKDKVYPDIEFSRYSEALEYIG